MKIERSHKSKSKPCFEILGKNLLGATLKLGKMKLEVFLKFNTVRPRDTRLEAARTSQVHVFELDPKIFEMNEFM